MVSDTAFTQSALAILVTLGLGLLLQAKLVGAADAHPMSRAWRMSLAIFELFLTTTLSVVGVALGYFLFQHLASAAGPLGVTERRGVGSLLLLLVSGLALMAVVNRVVSVAWKVSGGEPMEPVLDTDLVYGLGVAFVVAVLIAGAVYEASGRFGAAWLLILIFGLLVVAVPPVSSAAGRRLRDRLRVASPRAVDAGRL